jgi:polysaccharide pyruvyl transferase WcaK-like protein
LKSDDGFRVKEVLSDLQLRHPLQENKETKQRIGICIHRQENQEKHLIEKWWINFLSNLKTYPNIEVRGFCFNADPAQDFSTLLYLFEASGHQREAVQQPPENFRDAIKHLRNFNLVVSTRFHSIVVAHALKLPYLAIASGEYYFNKISSIPIAQDSQSKLLDPTKNTPQEAVIQLTSCLNKAQSTKQILNP